MIICLHMDLSTCVIEGTPVVLFNLKIYALLSLENFLKLLLCKFFLFYLSIQLTPEQHSLNCMGLLIHIFSINMYSIPIFSINTDSTIHVFPFPSDFLNNIFPLAYCTVRIQYTCSLEGTFPLPASHWPALTELPKFPCPPVSTLVKKRRRNKTT